MVSALEKHFRSLPGGNAIDLDRLAADATAYATRLENVDVTAALTKPDALC
jgi:hypothetical protein